MKRIMLSLMLSVCLCLIGCGSDRGTNFDGTDQEVTLSQSEFTVDASNSDGGAIDLTVTLTTDHEFSVYSEVDWMSVSPTSGTANYNGTLTITVQANASTEQRSGRVCVWCGGTREYVTVTQAGATFVEPDIDAPEGYTLVWHDEFDGDELNGDWTFETWPAGYVNNELQKYVKDDEVVTVSGGTLKINLLKDGSDVKSARLYAKRNTGWKYGYIEARLKVPAGKGTWPAFWMMPVNFNNDWPASGEIDIMEHVGYNANVVHSTIHCTKYNNTGTSIESASMRVPTATTEFHTYACQWSSAKMTFYVDGEHLLTYANDGTGKDAWPFDAPFYVILNLAWGGNWGGAQGIDESCLPETFEIDYVRVFQQD